LRHLSKWRRQSFKLKLIGATIAIFLVTITIVSMLSYERYTLDFQRQSNERTQQIIDQVSLNIDNYIDDLFRLSLSPYNNLQVLKLLDAPPPASPLEQLMRERQIEDFLNQMIVTPRLDILQVYIITADRVYTNGRATFIEPLDPDFRKQEWYRRALGTQKPIFLPAEQSIPSNPGVKIFSVVKQLRSLDNTTRPLAVIKVDANYSGIQNICDKVNLGVRGGLLIADRDGNAIYSSIREADAGRLYREVERSRLSQFQIRENGEPYLVASTRIDRAGWTVISLSSVRELNKSAVVTRNFTIAVAAACALLASVVLFVMIRTFLKPLMRIVALMKQVKLGNLAARFPENGGEDEIGYIGTSFNAMLGRIEEMLAENTRLTKEVYETRYLQKEAQIHALVSQIRPHFIYNTLHTIGALIQVGRTEQATDNLEKLSFILRGYASIDQSIPLRKEIELLEAYLGIQQSRFGDRLTYEIRIDEALRDFPIPAILLQPIVENSVIHGCEERKETTAIRITGRIAGRTAELVVADNGGGIPEAKLRHLKEKMGAEAGLQVEEANPWKLRTGIGLTNVHNRLRMRYGEPYGLEIESGPGGTVVKATLPYPA